MILYVVWPLLHIRVLMCANGHAACWRMKHDVENDLLIVFFVKLGKWEMHPYIACLPLPPMIDARISHVSPFS
jgi:hypothetical protein